MIPETPDPFIEAVDAALDDYLEPDRFPAPFPVPGFDRLRQGEPTSDVQAEKIMRRLVAAYRRRAAIIAEARDLIEPIEKWRDEQLAPWDRRIAWLADHLKIYAVKRRVRLGEKDPAAKTLKLPSGAVPTRRTERRVDVSDPDAFLAWAEVHRPDLVRRPDPPPPAPAKTLIHSAAMVVEKDDGELVAVIDGEVVPGLIAYDVSIDPSDPKPDLT
jgi:phage host-nuclease inhibitor protein Gam